MHLDRNIKLVNRYTMFVNMSCIIAVVVPYYRDVMGIGFKEFLIGEAAFAAVVVLLEVPTGWISDVWKRKNVLLLGALVNMIGYSCLLYGKGLLWAIIGQAIIGVGVSLISGTHTAFLYDSLLSAGREAEFRKREGTRGGIQFYSVAAASVVGGFMYVIDPHLVAMASVVALFGAMVCAFLMDEPERHKKRPEKHPIADMLETARYALRGHAEIGFIILFAAAFFCSTKMIMWTQQPYYMAVGIHESLFGVLMACGFMLAGISSQLGHKLDGKQGGNIRILIGAWVAALLVCVGAAIHVGISGVALLMLGGSCLYGITGPRVSEAINNRVGSERRATILSTQNLMVSLCFIPVSWVVGIVSDSFGIAGALLAIAAWLGFAGLFLAALMLKKDKRKMMLML